MNWLSLVHRLSKKRLGIERDNRDRVGFSCEESGAQINNQSMDEIWPDSDLEPEPVKLAVVPFALSPTARLTMARPAGVWPVSL